MFLNIDWPIITVHLDSGMLGTKNNTRNVSPVFNVVFSWLLGYSYRLGQSILTHSLPDFWVKKPRSARVFCLFYNFQYEISVLNFILILHCYIWMENLSYVWLRIKINFSYAKKSKFSFFGENWVFLLFFSFFAKKGD